MDHEDRMMYNIIFYHRLPQVFRTILTGITLSIIGMLLQSLFRKPLAGPSIIERGSFLTFLAALFFYFVDLGWDILE
ncbi:MAG: iron chelate uptake ABC transporter family permease subunit [Flavobacteriales bacterium AspAUS03]